MGDERKRKGRDGDQGGPRSKKSKLRYFVKTANKQIEPNWQGIFATCDKGRESRCVAELYQLFEEYAERLYGPEVNEDIDDIEASVEDEDRNVDDIEATIAAEIQDIKSTKTRKSKRFTSIRVDTPCIVFFHTRRPIVPTDLVYAILEDCLANNKQQTRYTQRLTPITRTSKASIPDLEIIAKEVLSEHFQNGQVDIKFAIRPNLRDHNTLKRDDVIKAVARVVGPNHKVDLKNYDVLILVEIFRNVCGISVVRDYEHLKRFSLARINESSDGIDEKKTREEPSLEVEKLQD